MEKSYYIYKTCVSDITIDSQLWEMAEKADIDCINWAEWAYAPRTEALILQTAYGLAVKFTTDEKPYAKYLTHNAPTNRDSCVELFINFSPETSEDYLNFELNANGMLALAFGKDRLNRKKISLEYADLFRIETKAIGKGWQIKFFIPFTFVRQYYGNISRRCSGNMYKCGDKTPTPHYLSWSPINTPNPDFHTPRDFGWLLLNPRP